ncbi:MAG: hypothetical protein EOP04_12545 [Proteobacteria bacterium]|nr:MAG: hypothetical protein EOP04_12545 [Pseudomonadota bacterium]
MKLSGTNRLGIVISLAWIISCSLIVAYQMYGPFKSCESTAFSYLQNPKIGSVTQSQGGFDLSTAIKVGETNCPPSGMERQLKLGNSALIAFLPIIVFWLLGAAIVISYRWIKAGYNSESNNA